MNLIYEKAAKELRKQSDVPGLVCLRLAGQNPAITAIKRTAQELFYYEVYKKYFKKAG